MRTKWSSCGGACTDNGLGLSRQSMHSRIQQCRHCRDQCCARLRISKLAVPTGMLGSAMFSRRAASLAWASWSSQSSAAPVMTLLMKPSERERCGRSGPLLVSGSVGSEGAEAAAFNLRCSRLLRSAWGQTRRKAFRVRGERTMSSPSLSSQRCRGVLRGDRTCGRCSCSADSGAAGQLERSAASCCSRSSFSRCCSEATISPGQCRRMALRSLPGSLCSCRPRGDEVGHEEAAGADGAFGACRHELGWSVLSSLETLVGAVGLVMLLGAKGVQRQCCAVRALRPSAAISCA